jgi:hypothetical protein
MPKNGLPPVAILGRLGSARRYVEINKIKLNKKEKRLGSDLNIDI